MSFDKQFDVDGANAVLITMLPGPNRKRVQGLYQYRLIYRHPEPEAEGCLVLWQVTGGRQVYQIALQRDERKRLHWHCTCADAVYRGEKTMNHVCKHVKGLLAFAPSMKAA
ncbi:MAG TPA: hypothetical protein VKS79_03700 [Gemmataceae bacterium]|nr:hypothetical protein [Gemmataceae bacterium]